MEEIPERVGIISGKGKLSVLIAEEILKLNSASKIFTLGFAGEVDKKIRNYSTEFVTIQLGELAKVIEYFKKHKVEKIFMAGLVSHNRIFDRKLKLDRLSEEMFNKLKDKKADSILSAVATELEKENIRLLPMISILSRHIATEGYLTDYRPTENQIEDINFGWEVGCELSKLDIGQTLVVKNKCVVAVESIEGTDKCLYRAGKIAGKNTVVIKLAKQNQDMRFDLPVIGPRTIKVMNRIGSRCIVVEANKTCIIDKPETIELANKYRICIFGRKRDESH